MPEIPPETQNHALSVRNLYEADFYAWTQEQVMLLRNREWHRIDVPNLIEEIESLGRQQRQALRNRLSVLVEHLLQWHYQPQHRSRSWLATLRIQRLDIADLLEDNLSLKPYLETAIAKAYPRGLELAVKETNWPQRTFPTKCPYSVSEILDDRFYPGEPSQLVEE